MVLVWNVLWSVLPFVGGTSLGGSQETQFHHSRGPRRRAWKWNHRHPSTLPGGLPVFLPKAHLPQYVVDGSWYSDTEHIFQHVLSGPSLPVPSQGALLIPSQRVRLQPCPA